MYNFLIVLSTLFLLGCGTESARELPIQFFIHSDYPAENHKEIFDAANILNEAVGTQVFEIVGVTTAEYSRTDGKGIIYNMDNVFEAKPEAVGRALSGYDEDYNLDDTCDILIENTLYGGCFTNPDGSMLCTTGAPYDVVRSVLMHEMIHCTGVWYHSENQLDLMYKTTTVTMPTEWDIDQVKKALDL